MKTIFSVTLLLVAATCQAAVIFNDDFDSSLAASTLNADIPGWDELNGTVDYIKQGGYGLTCAGGTGGCIDLDGSTFDAADFTSTAIFNLIAGRTYTLSFDISGNQRVGSDNISISFGGSVLNLTLSVGAPYTTQQIVVTPGANTSSAIVFSNQGGDNFGAILDNVVLDEKIGGAVPEPSTLALMGIAGAAVLTLRRKR